MLQVIVQFVQERPLVVAGVLLIIAIPIVLQFVLSRSSHGDDSPKPGKPTGRPQPGRKAPPTATTSDDPWERARKLLLGTNLDRATPAVLQQLEAAASSCSDEADRVVADTMLAKVVLRVLTRAGCVEPARKVLAAAAEKHADSAWVADAGIDLIVAAQANDTRSLKALESACERAPRRSDWHTYYAQTCIALGDPSIAAVTWIEAYQRANPDNLEATRFLAEVYEHRQLFNETSQPVFALMTRSEPNEARWFTDLAHSQRTSGQIAEAGKSVLQALKLDPRHQPAILLRAQLATVLPELAAPLARPTSPRTPADSGRNETPQPTVQAAPRQELRVPGLPPRYTHLSELGAGGMGVVYKAYDSISSQWVAVKLLRASNSKESLRLRERFLEESRIMMKLAHPTIPRVFEVSAREPYFIAIEFIEGEDLRKLVRVGIPEMGQILVLAIELASGFAHAAERGVLHRDIKPENILVDINGQVRIIDFGLAREEEGEHLTQSGIVVGTPWYLPIERLRGAPATQSSEIYAFGMTLYEIIAGQRPYVGNDIGVVFVQEPRPLRQLRPDCLPDLEALVLDCLSKNPANRPASFGEIEQELQRIFAALRPADGPLTTAP